MSFSKFHRPEVVVSCDVIPSVIFVVGVFVIVIDPVAIDCFDVISRVKVFSLVFLISRYAMSFVVIVLVVLVDNA